MNSSWISGVKTKGKLLAVQESAVPAPVRRFIAGHIESVGQLEVLLLLRAAADKEWTTDEVARAVVTQPASAEGWLEMLRANGLLARADGRFRYSPPSAEVERAIDDLAESYAKYRVAVIGLIFSKPSEHVRDFPEAFRLRRPKG
jgi:hypothetical protein